MNSPAQPTRVRFEDDSMWVDLSDGWVIGVPLEWFPWLLLSTAEQREQVRMSSHGLHWDALEENISVEGLLIGQSDPLAEATTLIPPDGQRFIPK